MASTLSDQRATYQPVLSTTADYLDYENDQANIRAGRRTQQAISNKQKWQSYLSISAHKRFRLSPEDDLRLPGEELDPQPPLRRTRLSLPVRIVHRLTNKDSRPVYDPNTIPVVTKREERKLEKRAQRHHDKTERRSRDELAARQYDQISHQLEVNQRNRLSQQPHTPARRSVRDKVKDTIIRSTRTRRVKTQPVSLPPAQLPSVPQYVPHLDDFEDKSHLRSWFGPADFQAAVPQPIQTIHELPPAAELPAESISPPYDFRSDVGKRHSDDGTDLDILSPPPPIRSPSPCLSSLPRRGITMSESPYGFSNKQMQCDCCHDAIKITGFHYACGVCDNGDRLYCTRCFNDGQVCRHDLVERTRNIKRHPTNPELSHRHQERRSLPLEQDLVAMMDVHAELSALPAVLEATSQTTTGRPAKEPQVPSPETETPAHTHLPATSLSAEVLKDLDAKRREQDIVFREKEVTLREREAMLREREVLTASRERDTVFMQQMHAAAIIRRERAAEVGAQFMPPPSRHPSHSFNLTHNRIDEEKNHRVPSVSSCRTPSSPSRCQGHCTHHRHNPSPAIHDDGIKLHSSGKGRKPNIELVSAVAALEASVAGIEIAEPACRSHANSAKRKASAPGTISPSKGSGKRGPGNSRRGLPKKNTQRSEPDDDEDSEGSGEESPKRQKPIPTDQQDRKLFACPYFKHEPMRYAEGNTQELHYRGCAGGLYRDISRVKQHLKRVHHRPDYYCRRCFTVFDKNEELEEHSSQMEGCNAGMCPFPEKLDETQQNKIHVKRPGKDPKDLWYEIFRIIFPGMPVPSSPYIEPAGPKSSEQSVLEQFVRLMESKLDTSVSSQPWLCTSARQFLSAQMRLTMQETIQHSAIHESGVPLVMISPVSSKDEARFPNTRQGSHSSRASSSAQSADAEHPTQRTLLSHYSPVYSLRPALKVTTHGTRASSSSSGSPLYSVRSQSSSQFPTVPLHVQDDLERQHDIANGSWQSGDDIHVMNRRSVQEPASASSGKSVTFATPPPFVTSWRETNDPGTTWTTSSPHQSMRSDVGYFNPFAWTDEAFMTADCCSQPAMLKRQASHAMDSAYGTMSSQSSSTSMYQPQYMEAHHSQQCQAGCVDPQMLLVNPAEVGANMPESSSADLRAYLNRNHQGYLSHE